ncbi:MAG: EAL domain-containing protein [Clostridia bacterium]|nr:EAL domain-containing protein [Clostridia bacterium]
MDDRDADMGVMCDRALLALRSVKNNYDVHWAWYDASMREELLEEQHINAIMKTSLENGEFVPYFQPQYNYDTGKLIGAEALVRWIHPQRGMIPPGQFIPVFEKNGFIYEMDCYIWEKVARSIRGWLDAGIDVPPVSVNVSRRDLYHPDLVEVLKGIVEKYGLTYDKLRLEITESAYMDNREQLLRLVSEMKKSGFHVEMDDFGNGYSSLNTLKDVPVDVLKMDMAFLSQGKRNGKGGNILSSVVRMAHGIDLPVIAEGVENALQAEFLKSIGCLYMQGYFFARPMSGTEFEKLIRGDKAQSAPDERFMATFDNASDFLDATTQSTLLFNSFVGGAAILEYHSGKVVALRINDNFYKILGTNRDDHPDMRYRILESFTPQTRDAFVEMLETAIRTGEEADCETCCTYVMNNGSPTWIFNRVRCLARKVDSYILYISIENITSRKLLSAHLSEQRRELSAIINSIPGGIFKCAAGEDDQFTYISDTMLDMLGYTREEFVDKFDNRFSNMIYREDRGAALAKIRSDIEITGSTDVCEYRIETSDGNLKWVHNAGRLVEDDDGQRYFVVVIVDIDERKALEIKHERDRAEIETMINSIPGGVATIQILPDDMKLIYASDGVAEIAGLTMREFEKMFKNDPTRGIYPPDKPMADRAIRDAASNRSNLDATFRIVHKDGSLVWINMYGQAVDKIDGYPVMHVVYHNFSATTQLYREILNETDQILLVSDIDTQEVLYANRAAAQLAGREFEQAVDMTCYEYLFGDDAPMWTSPAETIATGAVSYDMEYKSRHYRVRVSPINWNGHNACILRLRDRTDAYHERESIENMLKHIPGGLTVFRVDKGSLTRTYMSDNAFDVLGYTRGETPQPKIEDTFGRVHPDDLAPLKIAIKTAISTLSPFYFDMRIIPRYQPMRWVNIVANPATGEDECVYFYGIYTDVTWRKSLEGNEV